MSEIKATDIAEVTELFEKEPLKIAQDAEARAKVIAYLRAVRENIAEMEEQGKRISKKGSYKGVEVKIPDNVDPLDAIIGGSS